VSQQGLDRAAYALAKEFLLRSGAERGITPELIEKYLYLSRPRPESLAGLYERMLESAQSGNMNTGVIGGSIGGVGNLGPVLCDFDPLRVLEKYRSGWEDVLDDIVGQLKPRGSVPRTPRSIWPRYCRSILSGARFLSRFSSAEDFYGWVDFFDEDERARPALPLLVAQEIEGIGFALACDYLAVTWRASRRTQIEYLCLGPELRHGEVLRIHLPGTSVNNGRKKGRGLGRPRPKEASLASTDTQSF
jgi:hypothetical protein